jgi:hypothetical protein
LRSKGQHSGSWFEHPSHGYSTIPPAANEAEANCAVVQDPVKIFPPVNVATAVVATDIAPRTVVEADGPVEELVPLIHPIKSGMATFTFAHSATLKARAAVWILDMRFRIQFRNAHFAGLPRCTFDRCSKIVNGHNLDFDTSIWHRCCYSWIAVRLLLQGMFADTTQHEATIQVGHTYST